MITEAQQRLSDEEANAANRRSQEVAEWRRRILRSCAATGAGHVWVPGAQFRQAVSGAQPEPYTRCLACGLEAHNDGRVVLP